MPNSDVKSLKVDPMTGRVVEISLYSDQPRGTTSRTDVSPEITPAAPAQPPSPMKPYDVSGLERFMTKTPFRQVEQATYDPGFTRLMGALAEAFTGNVPGSWQNRIGQVLQQTAATQQAERMRQGEQLTGLSGFGITPEERAAIVTESLGERGMAAREHELGLTEERLRRELGLAEEELGLKREQVGLMAREETPEERYTREMDVAAVRALSVGNNVIRQIPFTDDSGNEWIQTAMVDDAGNVVKNLGTVSRFKLAQSTIPVISTTEREATIDRLFEQIKNALPREHRIPLLGGLDRIEPEDLDRMIREGNLPEEYMEVADLIDAYRILRDRLDIAARATDAPEELKAEVVSALANIGYEIEGATPAVEREWWME